MALRFNPFTGDFDVVDSTGGGGGTVTSVAGGVGITNTPEPIVGAGTVNLDISSLTAESSLAAGDEFAFVDVSAGTAPADQRKVTFANLTAALNSVLDHGGLLGLGDDDHPQYLRLAGRTGSTNNPIISTDNEGIIQGSALAFGLTLRANAGGASASGISLLDNLTTANSGFQVLAFAPAALTLGGSIMRGLVFGATAPWTIAPAAMPNIRAVAFDPEILNTSGVATATGILSLFHSSPTFTGDAATLTIGTYNPFDDGATFQTTGGGAVVVADYTSLDVNPFFNTGSTCTEFHGVHVRPNWSAATVVDAVGIEVGSLAPASGTKLSLWVRDAVLLDNAGSATELRFMEPGGPSYTSFKAQAQAVTIDYTLPAAIVTNGFLRTDAAGVLSWSTAPVLQAYSTVQEEGVGLTQRSILNFIGGGFTAADDAGNVRTNVTLDADLNAIAAFGSTGFAVRTAADTWAQRTLTSANALLTISNPAGVAGDPVFTVVNSAIDHGTLAGLGDDDHTQYALLAGRTGTTNDLTITTSNNGIGSIYGGSDDGATLELNASSSGSAHTGFVDVIDILRPFDRIHQIPGGITITNNSLVPESVSGAAVRNVSLYSMGQDGITLTGTFPSFRAVSLTGAVTFDGTNAIAMGLLFNHQATYANSNASNFGNIFTLVDNPTLNPTTTAALTMSELTGLRSVPTITSVSGGTLTISNMDTVRSGAVVNTGNTVTTRRGLRVAAHTGAGTVTNEIGVDVEAIVGATLTAAVRSVITSGTGKWFLLSTASADSSIVGRLFLGGAASTVPNTDLDVDGDLATRAANLALANGNNDNIAIGARSFIRVTGPTAAFAIRGIASGFDGKRLTIYNTTTQNMTINDEDAGSTAANRIRTLTGGARATTGEGSVDLIYDATLSRWLVIGLSG